MRMDGEMDRWCGEPQLSGKETKLSNHHFINIQTSVIHRGMTRLDMRRPLKSGQVSFLMVKTTVTKSEICFKKHNVTWKEATRKLSESKRSTWKEEDRKRGEQRGGLWMKRATTTFRRKKAGWNKEGTRPKRTSQEMSGASEWTVVDSGLNHECEGWAEWGDRSISQIRHCFKRFHISCLYGKNYKN